MENIIKENGIIWLVENQDGLGRHKRMTMIGTYEEDNNDEKPQKTKRKNTKNGDRN